MKTILKQIEAELGDRTNRFTLWHDGGEWIVSLEGKPENSKTLAELVGDAIKLPLPDHYAGELNTKRIKAYSLLHEKYDIQWVIVMDIFNKGADWYKEQLTTTQ